MAIDSKTPLALYKANLELVLRLGTLLQENRRRWNLLGTSSTTAAIERTLAETERMLTSNDWSSLAAMPGEEFWKSMRDDAGPLQGSTQAALANQSAFADGLREAFSAWQQQSVDALGESGLSLGKFDPAGFMNLFQARQTAPAAPAKSTSKAGTTATGKAPAKATRAPARKKTSAGSEKRKAVSAKPATTKKKAARKAAPAKPVTGKKGSGKKGGKSAGKRR